MKLSIIGSREFNDYNLMIKKINELYDIQNITTIISGGAIGADKLAEKFAKDNNIKIELYLPDWNRYGKSAGYIRNKLIIENCDEVIAFWNGKSPGTKLSIDIAEKLKKIIHIIKN
jgi:hypothetical protein